MIGQYGVQPGQFKYPLGIAVDKQGNVWVADTQNERLQKLSPDGTVRAVYGTRGAGPGQVQEPVYIAFDSQGALYVAEKTGRRVQKLVP